MKVLIRSIFLALFSATALGAQPIEKEIAKCYQIEGELKRLDCYDVLARRHNLSPTTTVESKNKGVPSNWKLVTESNPIDDSKTVQLFTTSSGNKPRFGDFPVLTIRCMQNKTELYVDWDAYLGGSATVTYRVGKEAAKTSEWQLSTDSKASFYPGSPLNLIRNMFTANTFTLQVTPYSENPITAIFDISHLESTIQPLRETCGW